MSSLLFPILIVVQVIAALTVIVLVMLQQGKGADMGSAFGAGSAGSLFGAAGASNFFSRMTKWAAIVFFLCTLGLAYIGAKAVMVPASSPSTDAGLMSQYQAVPVTPGTTGAGVDASAGAAGVPGATADPAIPSLNTNQTVPSAVPSMGGEAPPADATADAVDPVAEGALGAEAEGVAATEANEASAISDAEATQGGAATGAEEEAEEAEPSANADDSAAAAEQAPNN